MTHFFDKTFGSLPRDSYSLSGQVHYSASLYITQHLWNIFSSYLLIIKSPEPHVQCDESGLRNQHLLTEDTCDSKQNTQLT